MVFLKNYLLIFLSSWLLLLLGKFVFLLFFNALFTEFSLIERCFAIIWGYRFDIAASAMLALLATLFDWHSKTLRLVAAVLLAAMVVLQLSDMLYFADSNRHIGYEIRDTINDASSLFLVAWGQQRGLTILTLLLFPTMVFAFASIPGRWLREIKFDRLFIPKKIVLLLLSAFFIRGLLGAIPLTPWQAIEIGNEKLATLAINGSYGALYSLFSSKGNIQQRYIGQADRAGIKQAFAEIYADGRPPAHQPHHANVVFLFLESWNASNMQPYGFAQQTTPYFDAILKQSLRPKAAIAGGLRTTEGMFTTLASFQNPLGATVAKTQLQDKAYQTIVDLLTEQGYSSAFFQGTTKETSGTGAFAQKLGFQQSFGKQDVQERQFETNDWGVYDQDLYRFVLSTIENLEQPFIIGVNGATTHDDKLPEGVPIQEFSASEAQNKRLNALNFSDKALGAFVKAVEKRFPDTIFVLLADHTKGVTSSHFERFMVPFAIYGNGVKPRYVNAYVSQRDVAPTLLDILLGDYKKRMPNATGKSLLNGEHFYADYYHNGVLGWVEGMVAVEYTPAADKLECYDVSIFAPLKIQCQSNHEKLKSHATVFSSLSQELLFEGRVLDFHLYRAAVR